MNRGREPDYLLRKKVAEMYVKLGNQSEVARQLGVSRQRVHQLLSSRSKEVMAMSRFLLKEKIQKVKNAFQRINDQPFTLIDLMDEAGVYRSFIHSLPASGLKEEVCRHPNYCGSRKKNKHLIWKEK